MPAMADWYQLVAYTTTVNLLLWMAWQLHTLMPPALVVALVVSALLAAIPPLLALPELLQGLPPAWMHLLWPTLQQAT